MCSVLKSMPAFRFYDKSLVKMPRFPLSLREIVGKSIMIKGWVGWLCDLRAIIMMMVQAWTHEFTALDENNKRKTKERRKRRSFNFPVTFF